MQRNIDLYIVDEDKLQTQVAVNHEDMRNCLKTGYMSVTTTTAPQTYHYFGHETLLVLKNALKLPDEKSAIFLPNVFSILQSDINIKHQTYKNKKVIALISNEKTIKNFQNLIKKQPELKKFILKLDSAINHIFLNHDYLMTCLHNEILLFTSIMNVMSGQTLIKANISTITSKDIAKKFSIEPTEIIKNNLNLTIIRNTQADNDANNNIETTTVTKDNIYPVRPMRTAMSLTFYAQYPDLSKDETPIATTPSLSK
jgi:hypothetical protein